jgi:hypothetical protein
MLPQFASHRSPTAAFNDAERTVLLKLSGGDHHNQNWGVSIGFSK